MAIFGLFGGQNKDNLNKGLEKTKENVLKKLSRAVMGKAQVDEEVHRGIEPHTPRRNCRIA
jgi:fused signal recognition particle receptor